MDEMKVMLIAAPEFSTAVAEQLEEDLPRVFEETINDEITWTIETVTDGFTSVAEDDEELLEGVLSLLDNKEWDYAISLTDIPLFHGEDIVLARVNYAYNFSIISMPACGWFLNKRLTDMVVQVVEDIYSKDTKITKEEQNERINQLFTFAKIKRINESEIETEDLRYVFSSRFYGMATILLGMTYDNRPWTIMPSLKSTIAVAFGSGAYAIIFPTLWTTSYVYPSWRLAVFMLLAIISMGLWIIQGHHLWEKETISDNRKYRILYNTTTLITLFLAVASFYIILIGLFLITIFVFVDPAYYAQQVGIDHLPTLMNFLQLAWLTASIGTVTGAVGVGLENEENVRRATYGYRQRERYRILEENREKEEQTVEETEEKVGD